MSAAPISIRRAGNDELSSAATTKAGFRVGDLSATPGGNNLFGTTPGGSRIVYSREQLLSLATSPLSHNLPDASIPNEIRSSPDKSAGVLLASSLGRSPEMGSLKAGSISGSGAGRFVGRSGPASPPSSYTSRSIPRSPSNTSNLPSLTTSASASSPSSANRTTTGFAAALSSPRSPPGNAFNFGGPVDVRRAGVPSSGSGLLSLQRPVDPTVAPTDK